MRFEVKPDDTILVEHRGNRLEGGERPPENGKEEDRGDEAGDKVARDLPWTRHFHHSLTRKILMKADEAMITTISVNSAMVEA